MPKGTYRPGKEVKLVIANNKMDIVDLDTGLVIAAIVPYYLKSKSKRYNNIREGYIYARVGDKNTPIAQNASINQIEMLWKKRLGLTQPPLMQILNRLDNKLEWVQNEDTLYDIYKPEFKLVEEYDDEYDRKTSEFYVYSQINSKFMYKDLKIICNETVLKELQSVVLDSGRYKTPVPQWGYVGYDKWGVNHKYTYKYYLKDSIDYKLQEFFFDIEDSEEVYAKRKFDEVILYFENEDEKSVFESYIESNEEIIKSYLQEAEGVHFSIDTDNKLEANSSKHRLSTGLALNKVMREFKEFYR